MYRFFTVAFLLTFISCKEKDKAEQINEVECNEVQIQGHRGARGVMPENTIQGFITAIKDSADVIELDIVISGDNKVVVSHEPFMSSAYVLTPEGDTIPTKKERSYNLYKMTYDSIESYDVGLKGNKAFPEQRKMKAYKPLLSEAFDSIEHFIKQKELRPISYNIELKSKEDEYGVYQPRPEEFVELVMDVIKNKSLEGRYNIQSFDPNILEAMRANYPEVPLAYLVYRPGITKNLEELTFIPEIYSPNYNLVTGKAFVDSIKERNMKLIPWTVNDSAGILRMDSLKVDGIISDFPVRVRDLVQSN